MASTAADLTTPTADLASAIAAAADAFVRAGGAIWQSSGRPQPEGSIFASWSPTTWAAIRAAQGRAGVHDLFVADDWCASGGRTYERHSALLDTLDILSREQDWAEEAACHAASVEIEAAEAALARASQLGCTEEWDPVGHRRRAIPPPRSSIGRIGFRPWKAAHDAAFQANRLVDVAEAAIAAHRR